MQQINSNNSKNIKLYSRALHVSVFYIYISSFFRSLHVCERVCNGMTPWSEPFLVNVFKRWLNKIVIRHLTCFNCIFCCLIGKIIGSYSSAAFIRHIGIPIWSIASGNFTSFFSLNGYYRVSLHQCQCVLYASSSFLSNHFCRLAI